jgi:hypothetical protein
MANNCCLNMSSLKRFADTSLPLVKRDGSINQHAREAPQVCFQLINSGVYKPFDCCLA